MRCILLSAMMLLMSSATHSQSNKVPPFKITQADGKVFLAGNLPFGKPVVLIYFSPECEDCHQLTKVLLSRISELKKASIAMITYMPMEKVLKFVSEFNLNNYSNLFIGTEGDSFFVGNYYKVGQLPFMALYNKNGDLIKIYNKEISIEDLLIHLRGL